MPAKLIADIVRRLPEGPVSMDVDENYKVTIKAGRAKFTISALSAEDYPELPDVENRNSVTMPQSKLREMIGGCDFCCCGKSKPAGIYRMPV